MEQVTQLKILIDELLADIRKHGLKEVSMEQYQIVCNGILKEAARRGVETYSYELIQDFLKAQESRCDNNEICPEYYRFQRRVGRMLNSLAITGVVDYSSAIIRKKYEVSDEDSLLVESILDDNGLVGEARCEMDIVLRHIISCFYKQGISVANISDDDLVGFITTEMPQTNPGSIGRTLRGIKYFSSYLKKHGRTDLLLDFSQLKVKTGAVKAILPYTQPEISAILEAVDRNTVAGLRDYAILLLGFQTGLRGVDIRGLRLSDIDWRNRKIKVCQSKTSEPLILPLSAEVMNAVADYILKGRPETEHDEIFLNIKGPVRPMDKRHHAFSALIRKYSIKADLEMIPGRSFHSLRRAFATELSVAGVPLDTISQLLGHKSIDEDKPYLSYNRDQIAFCAMGFEDIPLQKGHYAQISFKGGGNRDFS